MKIKDTLIIFLLITLLILGCSGIGQNIIYVKTDATIGGDGSSWEMAFNDLQDALNKAEPNSEIWVAIGVYIPKQTVGGTEERKKSFQLKNGIALFGGFIGDETDLEERNWEINKTILSGDLKNNDANNIYDDNSYHVLHGNGTDSTAIIDGFVVTGGNANFDVWPDDGGGGMNNDNGSPTIRNCTFKLNKAFADGGGMRNWGENSKPTVINCVFINNSATQEGGGMMNGPGSKPTVLNCLFTENMAGEDGGGMYNNESYNSDIINCVFYSNSASLTGGGMYNVNGSNPNIINCSFSLNNAEQGGGAIANNNGFPELNNSILWNNSSPTDSEIHNFNSSKTIVNYSFISGGYEGINNFDKDPLFLDPSLQLSSESSCIDAGDNDAVYDWVKTDHSGNPRIQNRRVDMGAFEFSKKKSNIE